MHTISRISAFIWPHRRRLLASLVFALLVAVLWSLTLLVTFPVVKVLRGDRLEDYVEQKIAATQQDVDNKIRAGSLDGPTLWLQTLRLVRDYALPLLPEDEFDTLAMILGVLLLATIVKGLCRFTQETLVASTVELTAMDIRKECFRHALELDYQTLAGNGTGGLMARFTNDINEVRHGMTLVGVRLVREPLKAAACLACALFVNWQLTLLSIVFVPVGGIVFYKLGRVVKRASHRMLESMTRIYKVLEETFEAIKVVIAFGGAKQHRDQFREENEEYYQKAMTIARIDASMSPITETIGIFAICLLLLPGAYLLLRETRFIWGIQLSLNQLDLEELAVMYTLLAGMIDPARKLSSFYSKLRRAKVAADRVLDFMDQQSLVQEPEQPRLLPRHRESVVFDDVSFTYHTGDDDGVTRPPALDGVRLEVDAGEVVAVVGENGSGKSTLVNLLPRYFDPQQGAVRIDHVDVREASLHDLRSQIGVVTQETILFDDTIYENIRYGCPEATREQIEQAARLAELLPLVESLPDGFETRVGAKGGRLSGGQRQRLTLARAILRDPAILILDEATSAVDAQSTVQLHEVLRKFVQGRTTFIVTHAMTPSLLEFVTRVVVMDRGKLVATGTHETLLDSCPVYQRLFDSRVRKSA